MDEKPVNSERQREPSDICITPVNGELEAAAHSTGGPNASTAAAARGAPHTEPFRFVSAKTIPLKEPVNIHIDPELEALHPQLTSAASTSLENGILRAGRARVAIILYRTREGRLFIVDGHNRFRICTRHHLPFDCELLLVEDLDAAKEWSMMDQLARRSLGKFATAYFIGRIYNARKRQGARTDRETSGKKSRKLTTAEALAREYKVDENTIRNYGKLAETVDRIHETVGGHFRAMLLRGDIKLSVSELAQLARMQSEEQRAIAERVLVDGYWSKVDAPETPTRAKRAKSTDASRASSREPARTRANGQAIQGSGREPGEASFPSPSEILDEAWQIADEEDQRSWLHKRLQVPAFMKLIEQALEPVSATEGMATTSAPTIIIPTPSWHSVQQIDEPSVGIEFLVSHPWGHHTNKSVLKELITCALKHDLSQGDRQRELLIARRDSDQLARILPARLGDWLSYTTGLVLFAALYRLAIADGFDGRGPLRHTSNGLLSWVKDRTDWAAVAADVVMHTPKALLPAV